MLVCPEFKRTLACAVTLMAAFVVAQPAASATLLVPGDHASLTDALAAATAGDVIQVSAGTYSTSLTGEVFPLVLADDVAVIGAGMGLSVVDAEGQSSVFEVTAPSGGRISGFTLTGGSDARGGGVHVMAGTVEIDRNLIIDNEVLNAGSGVHCTGNSVPYVHHNVIWENRDIDLDDPGDPHGVQILDSGARVEHNVIGRHDSNGLLVHSGSNPIIVNNIFFENGIPGVRGRGICAFGGPETVIAHNLFHGNIIAAILLGASGDVSGEVANDIDGADFVYGNIDDDPAWVDADGGDWTLMPGSPAIDAGDPASPNDPDGTVADIGPFYRDQSTASVPDAAATFSLRAARPNPFRVSTELGYELDEAAQVELAIYDVRGRFVAGLIDRQQVSGTYRIAWDGRDAHGAVAPGGIYFARLTVDGTPRTSKIVLTP